jgi:chromate transporter
VLDPFIYFFIYLKGSFFPTEGLSNLPGIHQDLLSNGWATESQFGQGIAIGQISPGPNGFGVISMGYLTYGYLGALLALIAHLSGPGNLCGVERQPRVQGAMHGVSLAVVGLLLTAVWTVLYQPGLDWRSLLSALGALGLVGCRKVHFLIILALAGGAGYVLYR